MSKFHEKKQSKAKANNMGANQKEETNAKELDLTELDQVAGGVSLRDVDKIETTDISDDTKSKI